MIDPVINHEKKETRRLTLTIRTDVFMIDEAQRHLLDDGSIRIISPDNKIIEVEYFDEMNGTCILTV